MKIKKKKHNVSPLDHEAIWNQYGKMIMGIAHKLSKCYYKPFDELLSEGVMAVFKKLPKWDSSRSSLCTYINQKATFGMLDYCIKPLREIPMDVHRPETDHHHPLREFAINTHACIDNPFVRKTTKPNWFKKFLNELTEESQKLINILFEAPEELYEGIRPNRPKTSQRKLRAYMIDVLDWTTEDVNKAFKEIIKCL